MTIHGYKDALSFRDFICTYKISSLFALHIYEEYRDFSSIVKLNKLICCKVNCGLF